MKRGRGCGIDFTSAMDLVPILFVVAVFVVAVVGVAVCGWFLSSFVASIPRRILSGYSHVPASGPKINVGRTLQCYR